MLPHVLGERLFVHVSAVAVGTGERRQRSIARVVHLDVSNQVVLVEIARRGDKNANDMYNQSLENPSVYEDLYWQH